MASITIGLASCSNKAGKCKVMTMTGVIMEVDNPLDVGFSKGDSIVLVNHCIDGKNPCNTSIYGFYKGALLQPDVVWERGKVKESYSYEKAIFLKVK